MEAKGRAAESQHRRDAWLAHTTASLVSFAHHSPRKMPTLESLTGVQPTIKIQTPDEMRAAFASWRRAAEKMGGAHGNS